MKSLVITVGSNHDTDGPPSSGLSSNGRSEINEIRISEAWCGLENNLPKKIIMGKGKNYDETLAVLDLPLENFRIEKTDIIGGGHELSASLINELMNRQIEPCLLIADPNFISPKTINGILIAIEFEQEKFEWPIMYDEYEVLFSGEIGYQVM